MGFIGARLSSKGKDFVSLGCGTYFIEYNTVLQYVQYSSNARTNTLNGCAFRFLETLITLIIRLITNNTNITNTTNKQA